MKEDLFLIFWQKYKNTSLDVRRAYVDSLNKQDRTNLYKSFYEYGWRELFLQNHIEHILLYIKKIYEINIIDLKIKAMKFGRVFLIEKFIWDDIEHLLEDDCDKILSGLVVSAWGRKREFYVVKSHRKNLWRNK